MGMEVLVPVSVVTLPFRIILIGSSMADVLRLYP